MRTSGAGFPCPPAKLVAWAEKPWSIVMDEQAKQVILDSLPTGHSIPAKPWRRSGTVLVVDDEEIIRNLASRMIEQAGFTVLTANDGEEAIRLYHQHKDDIACVLLDLTMPKMNGEETFR